MKQQYIIAANWKMNKTVKESKYFLDKFQNMVLDIPKSKVIFCPPFLSLFYMNGLLEGTPYALGAQNLYWEDAGAFTGEVSAAMLKSCGVTFAIIGHSERRHIFCETDEMVNLKLKKAFSEELIPIMCIGETLEERRNGETTHILSRQLTQGLEKVSAQNIENMIIAYEPVWAIGTGERANPKQIAEAHGTIRDVLSNMDVEKSGEIPILYGGSVKSNNVKELLEINNVNGYLIGGASLEPEEFVSIIKQTETKFKEE